MYLYHHVPEDQIRDVIYPLNQLKIIFPDLYKKHIAKYEKIREKDVEIPGFGFWNDCVNLMPVNPGLVKAELEKYGHNTDWEWRFYKINPDNLDSSKLIIMVMTENEGVLDRKYIQFSKEAFEAYCHIGDATRACFQKAKDKNEQPNTFARVPHVLYRDSINIKDTEVVVF